jgi:hypothetical protein
MKKVSYKLRKDVPIEPLQEKLKAADIGIAVLNEEQHHVNVEFYTLNGEDLSPEEILSMGTVIGLIEFLVRLEASKK